MGLGRLQSPKFSGSRANFLRAIYLMSYFSHVNIISCENFLIFFIFLMQPIVSCEYFLMRKFSPGLIFSFFLIFFYWLILLDINYNNTTNEKIIRGGQFYQYLKLINKQQRKKGIKMLIDWIAILCKLIHTHTRKNNKNELIDNKTHVN